jgi:hypothetical protein
LSNVAITPRGRPRSTLEVALPKKYEGEETSGITHTVPKKASVKDLNLD